jgi:signal transduction histidine kinase
MHSIETLAQRNEEMVQFLGTIFEISTVLMNTMDFDETVQIILHALIHPAGFDHDYVILFLVDDLSGVLRTVAEMGKNHFVNPVKELKQTLYEVQGSIFDDHLEPSPEVIDLKLPLDPQKSVLAKTVLEEKPILVEDPTKESQVNPVLRNILGNHAFASVPMFAKGKAVGVLLVNNRLSGRRFTDRDVKFLSMLAQLGGLSVETSRLYQSLEKANKELAHMRNRLLEADKLAALGEIAAGVAHEIRNPLVSIGGFTRRIRKKVGDDSQITPYLDVIIEEVTRLESTLNEMLDFSNEARDHFSEFDLNQIMDEALELLERELNEQEIEVHKKYGKDLPLIICDDRQVKHVFFNIFLNAIQAMEGVGGVLKVRTFAVMREGKQFVAGEVTDSGGGIPMDVIHNIFNPFFTTKPNGSGLGLSIVHKIVNRHFGHVEVHNSEGEGSSFLVTLPAAEEGRAYLK